MIPCNITIHALLEIVPVAIQRGQSVWAATCPMVGVALLYIVVSVRAWMRMSSVQWLAHAKPMFFHWTFLWYWKAGTIVQLTDYYYKVHTHTHHSFHSRTNTHHFPQTLPATERTNRRADNALHYPTHPDPVRHLPSRILRKRYENGSHDQNVWFWYFRCSQESNVGKSQTRLFHTTAW